MQWGIIGIWSHICGGSIIGLRTIVTAAHCITETPDIGGYRIIAGITLLDEENENRQVIDVSQTHLHPDYEGYFIKKSIILEYYIIFFFVTVVLILMILPY